MNTMFYMKKGGSAPDVLQVRINALDAVLREFNPRNLDSLIALRRQINFACEEARQSGASDILAVAEKAYAAGALDARQSAEALLTVMRKAVQNRKSQQPAGGDRVKVDEGATNRQHFVESLRNFEKGKIMESAAVAVVNIGDLPETRERHGAAVAEQLLTHVVNVLKQLLRAEDCVAPFEDGEIGVYLPGEDATGLAHAISRIESSMVRHPFTLPDGTSMQMDIKVTGQPLNRESEAAGENANAVVLSVGILSRNPITAKALEGAIKREGLDVIVGNDFDDPAAVFSSSRIDAVVLDIPAGQLMDIILAMRKALHNKRAVMVALVMTEDEGRNALNHGASEFFVRPVNLEALVGAIRRLARRGRAVKPVEPARESRGLLLVSEELHTLITLGSVLQKLAGYEVRLARNAGDVQDQINRNKPAAIIVDMRLHRRPAKDVLGILSALQPQPRIVLVIEHQERNIAAAVETPAVAGIITKPVQLLSLAEDVKKATGVLPPEDTSGSAACLQAEILRMMQLPSR